MAHLLSEAARTGSLGISMLYYSEQLQTVDSHKRNPQEQGNESSFTGAVCCWSREKHPGPGTIILGVKNLIWLFARLCKHRWEINKCAPVSDKNCIKGELGKCKIIIFFRRWNLYLFSSMKPWQFSVTKGKAVASSCLCDGQKYNCCCLCSTAKSPWTQSKMENPYGSEASCLCDTSRNSLPAMGKNVCRHCDRISWEYGNVLPDLRVPWPAPSPVPS